MPLMHSEYTSRLAHWQRVLAEDFYQPLEVLRFEGFYTMEYLTPEQAAKGPFAPVPEGLRWGKTWEYMWLRTQIVLPAAAEGEAIVLSLDAGGEATLFVNGEPFGTRRAEWVETPHHYICDNVLTQCGRAGERYELLLEVYAGHFFPDVGGCTTGPVLPGTMTDPKEEGRRAVVGRSTFGVWNEDAYQLWLDVSTLTMLMNELPEDSLRAAKIADGIEAYTRMVDFEQPAAERRADYRRARELLRPLMACQNGSTAPRMAAVGNAHLDLAWLWPMQETRRKTARTFAAQLRLLERYPEYRYIQSQPAAYEMCREHYPALYARICEAVREGRWIAEGAMYVEPDTNMPSGEALIRQLVFGKRFYRETFGVDSRLLWLPDTFGYSAVLPQLLRGCGVDYLVTQKIFWSYNEGDPFPFHYFAWKGMDGSTVTSFLPTSYTYRTDPKELCGVWRSRVQKRDLEDFLIPFGYGDGGGGPCRDHVEFALRQRDLEGAPRVEMTSPLEFFEQLDRKGGPKHTWDGELYFNAHRGTYTTQAAVKKNNRRSECALHHMELWGALAMLKGVRYNMKEAQRLWKTLLLHQFHDILPGSSIARVYQEANEAHCALQRDAGQLAQAARSALLEQAEGVTLFNGLGFAREEIIPLPDAFAYGAATAEGESVTVCGGEAQVVVPAMGAVSLVPAQAQRTEMTAVNARVSAAGIVLENECVRVEITRQGQIISYRLNGREMTCGRPMNVLRMYKDVPRLFDAWDIDSNYREQAYEVSVSESFGVICAEGLSASVRWTGHIGNSTLSQTITLRAGSPVLEFDTCVNWHELHRMLKVEFPVDVRAENALHEMQFGFVERPTHRSRSCDQQRFEVCNHRYTALCDNGHGCAVLNDCKYGVGVEDNSIELTLLRAAASPEMRSDQGEHHFRYGFTAWIGSFANSPVVQQAAAFNDPIIVQPGRLARFSAFRTDCTNVIVDTVKPADDGSGDIIVRLYESKKADTVYHLCSDLPVRSLVPCTMLEEDMGTPLAPDAQLHVRAFEVSTYRVKLQA
ncbi:MAG: glycosyl hydrolase-related protein [Clostridiales bacterium]|nr:glycosyl hydrolase-related protein [Clostridiales bacterium]